MDKFSAKKNCYKEAFVIYRFSLEIRKIMHELNKRGTKGRAQTLFVGLRLGARTRTLTLK